MEAGKPPSLDEWLDDVADLLAVGVDPHSIEALEPEAAHFYARQARRGMARCWQLSRWEVKE